MDGVPEELSEGDKTDSEVALDALLAAGALTDGEHEEAVRYVRVREAEQAVRYMPD